MTATTRIEDPNGLDWQAFSSRRFPGGRRHDLKAVVAYFAYKQLLRDDAEGENIAAEAVETWEDEGGSTPTASRNRKIEKALA
jgi:hypothetical protein